METKKFISRIYEDNERYNDVLTKYIISKWDNNVFLNGATGSGKSYFILHNLVNYCRENKKTILILCNRNALRNSYYKKKIDNSISNVYISSYQEIQENIRNGKKFNETYDYIVCDECHYFTSDSQFNIDTDLSFDWVINNNAIKVFMSGTGDTIFDYLYNNGLLGFCYTIPYNYSYVDNFIIYEKKRQVYDIINDILNNTNDKIIYFSNSIDMAIKVYNQFKEYSHFRCSKYVKNSTAKKINEMGCNECIVYIDNKITFEKRLLITTKALDNGIDLIDNEIKHIISDVYDMESAQQCLGRKRIVDKNDTVNFYVRNYNKNAVGGLYSQLQKKLNPIETFINNKEEFCNTYDLDRKFHSEYIYHIDENNRTYNKLAYIKMKDEATKMKLILDNKNYYIDMFLERFRKINNIDSLELEEEYRMKDELQLYLESMVGKILYTKDDKKELIERLNVKSNGKLLKTSNSLNSALEETNSEYRIKQFRTSKTVNGVRKNFTSAWKIIK